MLIKYGLKKIRQVLLGQRYILDSPMMTNLMNTNIKHNEADDTYYFILEKQKGNKPDKVKIVKMSDKE